MVIATLLIFLSLPAFAINGVITVLDAPIFAQPSESAKILQYYRKGEDIFIHSQEAEDDPYKETDFKDKEITLIKEIKDPLLQKIYEPNEESLFYKTLARSGREAYILKEHVLIEYKDIRELNQEVLAFDHTDYRIEEPLPKDYPFESSFPYRGILNLALGRPNFDPYPYSLTIKDQSFSLAYDLNFVWTKAQEVNNNKRFHFGAIGGFTFGSVDYVMESQLATQTNFRLYIGPHASYDVFEDQNNAFNIYMNTQVYLIDNMDISISNDSFDVSEARTYQSSWGISPNIGATYYFKNISEDFHLALGTNLRASLPRTYTASDEGTSSNIWNEVGAQDSYSQSFVTEISYFLSFTNTY